MTARTQAEVDELNRRYDREHGVDTWQDVLQPGLQMDSEARRFSERYGPIPERTFHAAVQQLLGDPASYTFFDVGAGKGKAMLMAVEYPFRRIVGVELAANMVEICRRNLRSFSSPRQRCFDLELLHADATSVDVPGGDVLVFLYAPFYGDVMHEVLDRIREATADRGRDVTVCWLDEDVHNTLTPEVEATLGSWGTLRRLDIALPEDDPGALMPYVGTFWTTRPETFSSARAGVDPAA